MSDDARDMRVEDALASLAPQARKQFKDELRERFVAGAFEEPEAAPAQRVAETPPASQGAHVPAGRPSPFWWGAVAAAALILVLARTLFDPGGGALPRGDWRVVEASGAVRFGDMIVLPGSDQVMNELITGERALENGDESARLYLDLDRHVLLELDPGTRIELGAMPTAGSDEPIRLKALSGGVRVATGPGFPGTRLMVETPHTELEVTGTVFAVDIYPTGTCVCCMEGSVCLPHEPHASEPIIVDDGKAFFDETDSGKAMDMPDKHADQLATFRERSLRHWQ